jgi:hypothetical protein
MVAETADKRASAVGHPLGELPDPRGQRRAILVGNPGSERVRYEHMWYYLFVMFRLRTSRRD